MKGSSAGRLTNNNMKEDECSLISASDTHFRAYFAAEDFIDDHSENKESSAMLITC